VRFITSPVDGVVQQLARGRPRAGAVIAHDRASRQHSRNRGLGVQSRHWLHPGGQDAEIKIDTFNFTRYGLLHGRVVSLSQDAIVHDNPQKKSVEKTPCAENISSEPKGQELVYAARISFDRTQMQVDENFSLSRHGRHLRDQDRSRSVISYLISPLLRYKQESLRER